MKKIKILHIFGSMDRGGSETWMMHVLRTIDRNKYELDFLVHSQHLGAYDSEILEKGCRLHKIIHPKKNIIQYLFSFIRLFKERNSYHVVHSHVHHFSGLILFISYLLGVQIRIAHSHNDTRSPELNYGFLRKLYLRIMRFLIYRYANICISVSKEAALCLFGSASLTQKRFRIIYPGIDTHQLLNGQLNYNLREQITYDKYTCVIGHIGRFTKQKNHEFILNIAYELKQMNFNFLILLIGDGEFMPIIKNKIKLLYLEDKIILYGIRSDISQLLINVIDIFIMPSKWEGLCMAVIESQLAGLPTLISTTLPKEVKIDGSSLHWIDKESNPKKWAMEIINNFGVISKNSIRNSLNYQNYKKFTIEDSVHKLCKIYDLSIKYNN